MPVGQLQYFQSKVDDKLHPYAVCAIDTSDEPKPLIVEVSPGALGNLPGAVELTEQIAGIAAKHNQFTFEDNTIHLSDKSYTADGTAVFAVFPHPLNPERYVAVHARVTPDAICWGSHLDMQLLPDYIVYSGGQLLDWGFWGNDWKSQ